MILVFSLLASYGALTEVAGLMCFQCSADSTVQNPCPTSSDDAVAWSQNSLKYQSVGDISSAACALRISGTGQIYLQGGVLRTSCNDTTAISYIVSLVNRLSQGSGAQFICCTTDGCNWSQQTAINNLPLGSSVSYAYISYIVVGVIGLCLLILLIIVLCLCGCEACGCAGACAKRNKKKDHDDEDESGDPASPVKKSGAVREDNVINLNDRYRTIPRPGDSRLATPITGRKGEPPPPSAAKHAQENENDDEEDEESEVEKKQPATKAPEEKKIPEGPKLPPRVDSGRINKSALYHFQH